MAAAVQTDNPNVGVLAAPDARHELPLFIQATRVA
jgi:hypothetical protein